MADLMRQELPAQPPAAETAAIPGPFPFHVMKPWKIFLFCLLSANLYLVYWHWRQWRTWRARRGLKIWPIVPAIFYGLGGFELFSRARKVAAEAALDGWDGAFLGGATIVLFAVARGANQPGMGALALAELLLCVPAMLAQGSINEIHAAVKPADVAAPRHALSPGELVALGVLLLSIVFIALLIAGAP